MSRYVVKVIEILEREVSEPDYYGPGNYRQYNAQTKMERIGEREVYRQEVAKLDLMTLINIVNDVKERP